MYYTLHIVSKSVIRIILYTPVLRALLGVLIWAIAAVKTSLEEEHDDEMGLLSAA